MTGPPDPPVAGDAPQPVRADGPQGTEALAAELALELAPGDLVLVAGDVGAGKTTFVRGACRALGVRERVTSPTFTLVHRYAAEHAGRRVDVSHLDLFRLGEEDDELLEADLELLLEEHDGGRIVFVEHPQVAGAALVRAASARARVELRHLSPDAREILVTRPPA